jgi:pimeloyl-ACP methyl ester carboxylesterase
MKPRSVIVLPGICGNELLLQLPFGQTGAPLWLSPLILAGPLVQSLALNASGAAPQNPLALPLIPGGCIPFVYGGLGTALAEQGYKVFCPSMDWRTGVALDAQRVVEFIIREAPFAPFALVCHSRGGLVARRAMGLLDDLRRSSLVTKVVTLGTPHSGSFVPVIIWFRVGDWYNYLDSVATGVYLLQQAVPVRVSIIDISKTWPGLYELLPRPGTPLCPLAAAPGFYYGPSWVPYTYGISAYHLDNALHQWDTLPALLPSVKWLTVAGTGYATPLTVGNGLQLPSPAGLVYGGDGDGTVPRLSALVDGAEQLVTGASHSNIIEHAETIDAVFSWLAQ